MSVSAAKVPDSVPPDARHALSGWIQFNRSSIGLSSVKRLTPIVAGLALAGSRGGRYYFANQAHACLGYSLHSIRLALGRPSCQHSDGSPGRFFFTGLHRRREYSFALYLFHGHMIRLFANLGFGPRTGTTIGRSVLQWQILYLAVSISASLVVAYLSWDLYEKHFLRLKAFFPTRKRILASKEPSSWLAPLKADLGAPAAAAALPESLARPNMPQAET